METDQRDKKNKKTSEQQQSLAAYDPLKAYLMEIRRYPFLSREEEYRLSVQFREKGDLDAVARLVMANLQFVVTIVREYQRVSIPLLDLIQEGNMGLMHAVKRFNPHQGTRISTHAAWWIRAYILRYIMKNWRLVKIGTSEEERRLFFNLRKEKERLEAQGMDGNTKLLASRLDVSENKLIEMDHRLGLPEISLSEPLDGSGTSLEKILPSTFQGADEQLEEKELKELFMEKIELFKKNLKSRDLEILEKRILADPPCTLLQLGKQFKISKERIRQIESQLLKKLKEFLKKEILPSQD